jgi:hypothetical protein
MGLPSHHSHHQHHHHQQHQGDNRLGDIKGQQTDIKATTDSAAGSHLPSFIQLYWAPQQTRHGWWDGEE